MSEGLKYRADIDGLRSLAVVPVVLYHAGVSALSGGYIGVDIFFVISGYLITGILLKSISTNSFSIIDFYKRRIKRIFPALIIVLSVSLAAAVFLISPASLIDFGKSLGFVSIFSSNFYFWKSVDYFSAGAHVQPLLHTWSLAVEEQFYIFYPLLLLLVSRTRLSLPAVLAVIGGISLVMAIFLLPRMPSAVFYLLPTRAWELVIGGLIACGWPKAPRNSSVITWSALVGLALMVVPMALYQPDTPFPGLAAVPPTLGAAMLIWSGNAGQSSVHRLLSTKPFVLVGRASYSFYLWHFPIFAFAAYMYGGKFGVVTGLVLSAVALLASLATLRWVETPSRNSRSVPLVLFWLGAMVALGLCGLLLARSDGLPQRLSEQAARYAQVEGDKYRHHEECMSNGSTILDPARACRLGAADERPVALLWGDSHAMVTSAAMEKAANSVGKAFLFAAAADCPPGLGFHISPDYQPGLTQTPSYRYCETYNRKMLELAASNPDISTVVISSRWSNWRIGEPANRAEPPVDIRLVDNVGVAASPAENAVKFEAGFLRLLEELRKAGKLIYVVGPLPEPSMNVPQALFVAQYGFLEKPAPVTLREFQARHSHALTILERVGLQVPFTMIWPHRYVCKDGICPLEDQGHPTFFDHNHLSVRTAERTSDVYSAVFESKHR